MTVALQVCLVVGIPSVLVILSALDFHRRTGRLCRKLGAMSAEMRKAYAALQTRKGEILIVP